MAIRDNLTPEGRRLARALQELASLEVRVGFQRGEVTDEAGTDLCDIAAWNELGTATIPARPFLRRSVDENEEKLRDFCSTVFQRILHGGTVETVLNEIGTMQVDLVQDKIRNGDFAANAPSTIRRKGSDHPLIDTGQMIQSVHFVVKEKGAE